MMNGNKGYVDDRSIALQQAHILHGVFQNHLDGKIDLRKDGDAKDAIQLVGRNDADLGGMLRQALTYYSPTPILTEYADTPYADPLGLIPRSSDGGMVGVNEIVKTVQTDIGKWVATGESSRNGGRVDVGSHPIVYASKYFTGSIGYTSQELDRIAFARQQAGTIGLMIDTVASKMAAVRRKYQELLNDVMALGVPGMSIYGIHNHPNITRMVLDYRPGALRTAEENIAIFSLATRVMNQLSKNRHSPDIVVLPKEIVTDLEAQFVGSTAQISTKKYITDNTSVKGFIPTVESETAGYQGRSVMHFFRRDADTSGMVPKAMTQLNMPVFNNGEYVIQWDAAVSGVHIDRPYKHLILEIPA